MTNKIISLMIKNIKKIKVLKESNLGVILNSIKQSLQTKQYANCGVSVRMVVEELLVAICVHTKINQKNLPSITAQKISFICETLKTKINNRSCYTYLMFLKDVGNLFSHKNDCVEMKPFIEASAVALYEVLVILDKTIFKSKSEWDLLNKSQLKLSKPIPKLKKTSEPTKPKIKK